MFMNPAAVPRASGRITSNTEAKMFASYRPLKNPQAISATISHPTEVVSPHSTTKGAPPRTPTACTIMRPPGVRLRRMSASQPPSGDPAVLASCTKIVAVSPAAARLR